MHFFPVAFSSVSFLFLITPAIFQLPVCLSHLTGAIFFVQCSDYLFHLMCFNIDCIHSLCTKLCGHTIMNGLINKSALVYPCSPLIGVYSGEVYLPILGTTYHGLLLVPLSVSILSHSFYSYKTW